MTRDKIVKMLRKAPKPDLEGAKKYALARKGKVFGIPDASAIKHWLETGNVLSARGMITKKFHPDMSSVNRKLFYRSPWDEKVDKAMREAGVKAWQATLPAGHVCKDKPADFFQFYISVHLGSTTPNSGVEELYEADNSWNHDSVWPPGYKSGVASLFLEELELDKRDAVNLAKFGYQNVVITDDVAVFVKLPKSVTLEWMSRTGTHGTSGKMQYTLSNTSGPAVVSVNGKEKYFIRGVQIEGDDKSAKEKHAEYFKDGKLTLTADKILEMSKYSTLAPALLEMLDSKEIAEQVSVRKVASEYNPLYSTALRCFTTEQIHKGITIPEVVNLTVWDSATYLLNKFSSEEIKKAVSLKQVIAAPSYVVRDRVLGMFSKAEIREQLTAADLFKSNDVSSVQTLVKAFSAEEIQKAVPIRNILDSGPCSRFAMIVIPLYKPEEVRAAVTVNEVLMQKNVETRRMLMKCFEPEAILEACDAVLISKEVDKLPCSCRECEGKGNTEPTVNELFSVDVGIPPSYRAGRKELGDPESKIGKWGSYPNRAKMLRYKCTSTDRVYAKFVPFSMQTANEAQAWSHHFTLSEYLNELAAQS